MIGILCFASALFPESELTTTLESYYGGRHFEEIPAIHQKAETADQGGVNLNLHLTPVFQFQKDFQFDYLVDANVTKRFESRSVDVNLNQAFADFLFYNSIGFQTGVAVIDYGNNSYFHPLQVAEFVPGLKERYGAIYFGSTNMGYQGIPSMRARVKLPTGSEDLYITLRQSEIFLNANLSSTGGNVTLNATQSVLNPEVMDRKTYSITDLSFVYKNLDLDLLGGYLDGTKPIWGGSLSYLFPFQIMGYAEVLYRTESYRPRIREGTYKEYEKGHYLNGSLGGNITFKDPLINGQNSMQLGLEIFYYGEGYDGDSFSEIRKFFQYEENYQYYSKLIQYERNFNRNGMILLSYTIMKYRISIQNRIVASVYQKGKETARYLAGDQLSLTKSFDQVSISLSYFYNSSMARDSFVFQGNDRSLLLNASIVF